jgi:hypothetical protein
VRLWSVLAFLLAAGATGLTISPEAAAPLRAQAAHGVCSKYKVGALTRAKLGKVRVDGVPRNATWPLAKRQRVRATPNAAGWICVKKKGTKCQLWNGGAVTVAPSNGILRFDAQEVSCQTTKNKKNGRFPTKTGAVITTHDPIFVVVVRPAKTVVKVTKGLLRVTGDGSTVVVGPKQQVEVPAQSVPATPVAAVLTQHQQSVTTGLAETSPKPGYVRPSAAGSPTISRIDQRGTIIVGIDNAVSSSEPWFQETNVFVNRYFKFLASRWGVKADFRGISPKAADRYLVDGFIDAFVSPNRVSQSLGKLWTMPFLKDPAGRDWKVYGATADDAFRLDVRSFLLQSIQQDDYGSRYRAAFGKTPPYAIFAPLGG